MAIESPEERRARLEEVARGEDPRKYRMGPHDNFVKTRGKTYGVEESRVRQAQRLNRGYRAPSRLPQRGDELAQFNGRRGGGGIPVPGDAGTTKYIMPEAAPKKPVVPPSTIAAPKNSGGSEYIKSVVPEIGFTEPYSQSFSKMMDKLSRKKGPLRP